MKETKIIAKAENFTATDFGKMSEIKDYTLEMGPEIKIPGKVFGGQSVNATGGEFSFQSFAPGTETGFLHTHKNHEELYFFLSGKGYGVNTSRMERKARHTLGRFVSACSKGLDGCGNGRNGKGCKKPC